MGLQVSFQPELIDDSVYLASGVKIFGDVTIGASSSVWFNSVIRGDTTSIVIGSKTNIQDGCIIHADPGFECQIGNQVTVGHGAIIHGAVIEDDVMIGMGAILLNGATIGSNSIIGAGSLIPEGCVIPNNSLVMGVPGKVRREVTEAEIARIQHAAKHYVEAAKQYAAKP